MGSTQSHSTAKNWGR